jgi:hypothetical protein
MTWPVQAAVLDGEACAGDGHEGIHAVFEERNRIGGDTSFMAFDVLMVDGQDVMRESWKDRRKRLEDLFTTLTLPRVGLVPVGVDPVGRLGPSRHAGGELRSPEAGHSDHDPPSRACATSA